MVSNDGIGIVLKNTQSMPTFFEDMPLVTDNNRTNTVECEVVGVLYDTAVPLGTPLPIYEDEVVY